MGDSKKSYEEERLLKEQAFIDGLTKGLPPNEAARTAGYSNPQAAKLLLRNEAIRLKVISSLQVNGVKWSLLVERVKSRMEKMLKDGEDCNGKPLSQATQTKIFDIILNVAGKLGMLTIPDDDDERLITRKDAISRFLQNKDSGEEVAQ